MSVEIYTVSQAAKYLQVCDKTVRRLITQQALIASKVGNSWRIQKKDIDLYLSKTRNQSKQKITE